VLRPPIEVATQSLLCTAYDGTMKKNLEIPWPHILAEGVVIIASILLALATDAWWDGVQERAEEREILSSLRAEFEANQEVLARTAGIHRRALGAMQDIVSASKRAGRPTTIRRWARLSRRSAREGLAWSEISN